MSEDASAPGRLLRIFLVLGDGEAPEPWLAALRQALPGAMIAPWTPGNPMQADYAVTWKPPQRFIDEQPQLKAMFVLGAGVDAVMALRLPPGLPVLRLTDAGMAAQMAEYVCHALLRHFREFDWYERNQQEQRWQTRPPHKRADFTVGILGMGVLGRRVADAVRGFGFPVVGWSRTPRAVDGVRSFAGMAQLDDFLAATRVLVCLLPLTPDTRGLLDGERLGKLQLGGYVINVSRGPIIVDQALLNLLDEGYLAGATLDVFADEPLPPGHPYWTQPFVNVTPHIAARTLRDDSVAQIATGIEALERGQLPAGAVDRSLGY